jgi:hypothetical protein
MTPLQPDITSSFKYITYASYAWNERQKQEKDIQNTFLLTAQGSTSFLGTPLVSFNLKLKLKEFLKFYNKVKKKEITDFQNKTELK